MKKLTTLILAASISAITLLASGNASATDNKRGMRNAGQNHGQQMQHKMRHHKKHKKHKGHMKNRKDVPAPIPGLLALAAAAGGGVMLRRKAKKSKTTE